jgi:hypothetical protein
LIVRIDPALGQQLSDACAREQLSTWKALATGEHGSHA